MSPSRILRLLFVCLALTTTSLHAATPTVRNVEIQEGAGVGWVDIILATPSEEAVEVSYRAIDQTATAGADYTLVSRTFTFHAFETIRRVRFDVVGDAIAEGRETFLFEATATTEFDPPSTTTATIGIVDTSAFRFLAHGDMTREGAKTLPVTVVRSAGISGTATVSYTTVDGTATAGQDYTAVSGTLSFAAGQSTATIEIALLGDEVHEHNESFLVRLTAATGASIVTPSELTVVLEDEHQRSAHIDFLVTNTNNEGAGSLRQAILDANARPGRDVIGFAIGSGSQTIMVPFYFNNDLPPITDAVVIDGTTQPGYSGLPLIEIRKDAVDPFGVGDQRGLAVEAGPTTIRGLRIVDFGAQIYLRRGAGHVITLNDLALRASGASTNGSGVWISGPASAVRIGGVFEGNRISPGNGSPAVQMLEPAVGVTIEWNMLGILPAGNGALNLRGPTRVTGNLIAMNVPNAGIWAYGEGNVIVNNAIGAAGGSMQDGIALGGAMNRLEANTIGFASRWGVNLAPWTGSRTLANEPNVVEGNRIGVDGTLAPRPNTVGFALQDADPLAPPVLIRGNTIGNSAAAGIDIDGDSRATIVGNSIGVAGAEGVAAPNGTGIHVHGGANNEVRIGGLGVGEANRISANLGDGVRLDAPAVVRGNSIWNNGGFAVRGPSSIPVATIDRVLFEDGATTISGSIDGTGAYVVDLYVSPTCPIEPRRDAKEYLGEIAVQANGLTPFSVAIPGEVLGGVNAIVVGAQGTGSVSTCTGSSTIVICTFEQSDYRAAEAASAQVVVKRSGSLEPTTIGYMTVEGTATAGVDFTPVSGTLTFARGETTRTIAIPIAADEIAEGDETFFVTLTAGDGARAKVTIVDDDAPRRRSSR